MQMTGSAAGTAEFDDSDTKPLPADLADGSAMAAGDLNNAKAVMTLTATTGCTYSFTAVVTRVSMSRPADGKMDVSLDFESTGPITQTWDESGA